MTTTKTTKRTREMEFRRLYDEGQQAAAELRKRYAKMKREAWASLPGDPARKGPADSS